MCTVNPSCVKYSPRPYQEIGRDFLRSKPFAMLGDAPGVGKTGQALLAIEPYWHVLVICPASVKHQWRKAFMDWRGMDSYVVESSNDNIIKAVPQRIIVNYDLVIRDRVLRQLLSFEFDIVICDEAHKLKSVTSKRTLKVLSPSGIRSRARGMWFLTGTPVKNRTVDLYPILRSCAPDVLGPYKSFMKFAYRYCGAYTGKFGLDYSGASHTEELGERLKAFMLRREKRDVLVDLPPRVVSKVDLPCDSAAKKLIEEEELKTLEQSEDKDPALFKLGEIQRIRGVLAKHKVPVCAEYIKDLLETEDKIVVFYYHKEVRLALEQTLNSFNPVCIDGSVDPMARAGKVACFATDPSVRVFLGQMEACGEGIDGLQQNASTAVFVEPSWSHTDIEQCIGRLERSGQRNDINVHILTIEDTIEAKMMETVAMKLQVDKRLYQQPKKEKENMAKGKTETRLEAASVALIEALTEFVRAAKALSPVSEAAAATPEDKPISVPVSTEEKDVSEDAIRARAGDICSLAPDGKGKTLCSEIIKKIGGGKIADLKTPKQRVDCLAALDEAYNELAA